ncbi:MAG: anhydro-N-acetylmuramic acid kinase [Arcanobacterium sp.]|nr:anhydro-N-acetylmuramic acid kinase [Arcanobacterium sp.]
MRILGIMTGTSADGCDGAVVDFHFHDGVLSATICETYSAPFSVDLRKLISTAQQPQKANGNDYALLHYAMGKEIAQFCCAFAQGAYDAVAMHGQTVNHFFCDGHPVASIQLGDSAVVAAATGVPVIHDIRSADIAAGGQGAPLVSILDWMLYLGALRSVEVLHSAAPAEHGESIFSRAFVNIGGIANATICLAGGPIAGDTGPGNCLIDAYISEVSQQRITYDAGGAIARSGAVNEGLLAEMLHDPYFKRAMPKSTGREYFNLEWIYHHLLASGYAMESIHPDVVATLTALTAYTLGASLQEAEVNECFVSGGGLKNSFLMELLNRYVTVRSTAELGLDPNFKEAVMMALIGYSTLNGHPGVVRAAGGGAITGARYESVLGAVAFPPGGFNREKLLADSNQFSTEWPVPLIVTRTGETIEH